MKLTTLFRLRKPDGTDPVNIEDFNDNFDVIDEELGKRLESTGAASDMTVAFEQASARTNLKTGEKISVSFGKIMKWFADLGTAAFQSVANNLTTTVAGSLLDARQGKILNDKYNQLNSEIDCSGQISIENMWQLKISEVYTIGRMCYFNMSFSNGLNPSGNVERFASGFPLPIGKNVACAAFDYDNDVTLVAIPCVISSTGELLISKPVDFQHTIICSGVYLTK